MFWILFPSSVQLVFSCFVGRVNHGHQWYVVVLSGTTLNLNCRTGGKICFSSICGSAEFSQIQMQVVTTESSGTACNSILTDNDAGK